MAVITSAPAAPRHHRENSLLRWLSQSSLLTLRLLIRLWRTPMTIVNALVLPVVFLVAVNLVLGDTITTFTGQDGLYRSVPLVALVGAISGATAGVVGVMDERADGFLARMWALPMHRAAGLTARLIAEAIRLMLTTLAVLAAGLVLGFRFTQGLSAALVWMLVPVVFGLAFAVLAITIALYWPKPMLVEGIQTLGLLGTFFCSGFVPVDQYPDWVAPLVEYQPMTPAVDAMRGLSVGGPVAGPMLGIVVWSVGIVAVCLVPLVAGYRRASRSR